jgi:hypothetical protein
MLSTVFVGKTYYKITPSRLSKPKLIDAWERLTKWRGFLACPKVICDIKRNWVLGRFDRAFVYATKSGESPDIETMWRHLRVCPPFDMHY